MIRELPAPGLAEVPHHIGFAVADLDTAMTQLSALFGLRWNEPVRGRLDHFRARGTRVHWDLSHVKSTGADGLIVELLQGIPGSTWHVADGMVFHHWAYAPSDRLERQQQFLADGWSVDLMRDEDDLADSTFAYFAKDGRPRVELCLP
ncbi:MAG TPA: VOC family protein [Jatrophihabitans sp.]|jgi:hypothetical protein